MLKGRQQFTSKYTFRGGNEKLQRNWIQITETENILFSVVLNMMQFSFITMILLKCAVIVSSKVLLFSSFKNYWLYNIMLLNPKLHLMINS